MNTSELNFAHKVRDTLDESLVGLPTATTSRLAAARRQALQRRKDDAPMQAPARALIRVSLGGALFREPFSWISRASLALPVIALIIGLMGIYQSEKQKRISEIAEIDALVLSDELPLSAYVDTGFNAYLARGLSKQVGEKQMRQMRRYRARAVGCLGVSFLLMTIAAQVCAQNLAPTAPEPTQPITKPAHQPTKPLWSEITPTQQQALMPLAPEWDKMTPLQKKKWLAISSKYDSLTPDQKSRLQDRMRDWVKLTPQQRQLARESYSRAKRLGPTEKTEKWEQYQKLPEEQKKKLAAEALTKKSVANLPPPSQSKSTVSPPPKPATKYKAHEPTHDLAPTAPAQPSPAPVGNVY